MVSEKCIQTRLSLDSKFGFLYGLELEITYPSTAYVDLKGRFGTYYYISKALELDIFVVLLISSSIERMFYSAILFYLIFFVHIKNGTLSGL